MNYYIENRRVSWKSSPHQGTEEGLEVLEQVDPDLISLIENENWLEE